eukprot:gene22302-23415_t
MRLDPRALQDICPDPANPPGANYANRHLTGSPAAVSNSSALTREDYRTVVRETSVLWFDSDSKWVLLTVILIGATVGIVTAALEIDIRRDVFSVLLIACLVGLGALVRRIRIARKVAAWVEPDGPTRVEADADHVTVTDPAGQRQVAWDEIGGVRLVKSLMLLDRPKPEAPIVIPQRAFGDHDRMVAFLSYCEDRLRDEEDAGDEGSGVDNLPSAGRQAVSLPPPVTIRLNGSEWAPIERAMRPRNSMSLAQASLVTTIGGGMIPGLLGVGWVSYAGQPLTMATWAACAWPGAVGVTFLVAVWVESQQRKAAANLAARSTAQTLSIDAEGMAKEGRDFQTRIAWSGIAAVSLIADCIVLRTTWQELHIAPRHNFADEREFLAFFSAARALHKAGRAAAKLPD